MKRLNYKVHMVTSPKGGEGKSTVAACLAVKFAKEGYIVGLIELDRYVSSIPCILGVDDMMGRSLQKAVTTESEKEIQQNFVPHKEYKDLYIMALNPELDTSLKKMMKCPEEQIKNIIRTARAAFDIVLLDCPSSYIEQGFLAPLDLGADRLVYVIDNDITKLAALKMYDIFFREAMVGFGDVVTVVNKDVGFITDRMIKALNRENKVIKAENIFRIPYFKDVILSKNEGELLINSVHLTKEERLLNKAVNSIFSHIVSFESRNAAG